MADIFKVLILPRLIAYLLISDRRRQHGEDVGTCGDEALIWPRPASGPPSRPPHRDGGPSAVLSGAVSVPVAYPIER
jgi:hypothetical protein